MLELAVFEQCSKIVRRLTTKGLASQNNEYIEIQLNTFGILKFRARFGRVIWVELFELGFLGLVHWWTNKNRRPIRCCENRLNKYIGTSRYQKWLTDEVKIFLKPVLDGDWLLLVWSFYSWTNRKYYRKDHRKRSFRLVFHLNKQLMTSSPIQKEIELIIVLFYVFVFVTT